MPVTQYRVASSNPSALQFWNGSTWSNSTGTEVGTGDQVNSSSWVSSTSTATNPSGTIGVIINTVGRVFLNVYDNDHSLDADPVLSANSGLARSVLYHTGQNRFYVFSVSTVGLRIMASYTGALGSWVLINTKNIVAFQSATSMSVVLWTGNYATSNSLISTRTTITHSSRGWNPTSYLTSGGSLTHKKGLGISGLIQEIGHSVSNFLSNKGYSRFSDLVSFRSVVSLPTNFSWHKSTSIESLRSLGVGISTADWYRTITLSSSRSISQIRKTFWGQTWSMLYAFSKWIGVKGSSSMAATSPDGSTWTSRSLPASRSWNGIATNGTIIVALATGSDKASSSTDGITWTERTLPASRAWRAICSDGSSLFVAVSLLSDKCITSTDGITWTERALPQFSNWTSVCYGNGKFVATTDSDVVAYSSDGITWTESSMPDNIQYNCVTYHLGQFTAVASGPTDKAAISTDGITWTRITMPAVADWTSIGPGIGNPND